MKKIFASLALLAIATFTFTSPLASRAASTTANALQTVIAAITITKTADLNFGVAPQGDPAKTISPADAGAAAFTVGGEPNRAYTITLPANVSMITGGGGAANKTIVVNNFVSTPSRTGSIGAGGTQALRVGATRANLVNDQVPGSYSTSFSVTVVY